VNTILPGFVLSALEATPNVTEKFFFWSGRGKLESIVRSRQTRLRKLFKLAETSRMETTPSLLNCFLPEFPLNESRFCWATKA